MFVQDFEGQKLAELLATALLSAVGVSDAFHTTVRGHRECQLTSFLPTGHIIPRRLFSTKHRPRPQGRSRRHRPYFSRHCSAVAVFQQASSQVVARGRRSKRRTVTSKYSGG